MPSFSSIFLAAAFGLLAASSCVFAQEVTDKKDQAEAEFLPRIEKFLPHSINKLRIRAKLRVAILGDNISLYDLPQKEDRFNRHKVWHYHFLKQLGQRFYYAGGPTESASSLTPRHIEPPATPPPAAGEQPILPPRGEIPPLNVYIENSPTIEITNYSRRGATSICALQALTTNFPDQPPDLVLWMYGSNDASQSVPLRSYADALAQVIKTCQESRTDLIVVSPPPLYGGDVRQLGLVLPYMESARELATAAGILFVDLPSGMGQFPITDPPEITTLYPHFVKHLGKYYDHQGSPHSILPNASGHKKMGDTVWKNLLESPPVDTLKPTSYFSLAAAKDNSPNLFIAVHQPPPEDTTLETKPMEEVFITVLEQPGGWVRTENATFQVKSFTGRRNTRVLLSPAAGRTAINPLGESCATGFILHEGKSSRFISLKSPIVPVSIDIPSQRIEGIAGDMLIETLIHNKQQEELKGTATAQWLDRRMELSVAVPPASTKSLKIRLPLPATKFARGPLMFSLKSGEQTYTCQRMIDGSQNFTANERMNLTGPAGSKDMPILSVNLDRSGLYSRFEIPAYSKDCKTSVSLMIDARAPDQRGKFGYVDAWHIAVPGSDGPFQLQALPRAVFGIGYDREINPLTIRAHASTENGGKRIVKIDIPRNNFYLHEWSTTDRGQNTLGYNAMVEISGTTTAAPRTWKLISSDYDDPDVTSLGVLQLNSKSTGEWSLRVY